MQMNDPTLIQAFQQDPNANQQERSVFEDQPQPIDKGQWIGNRNQDPNLASDAKLGVKLDLLWTPYILLISIEPNYGSNQKMIVKIIRNYILIFKSKIKWQVASY